MKKCNVCGVEKPEDDFYLQRSTTRRNGKEYKYEYVMHTCKECHKEKQRYRAYGVCNVKYDEMLAKQKGGCAICGCKLNSSRYTKLSVDHDHKTGKVRGLLCTGCNTALGSMKDSIERFESAIRYLKENMNEEIVCSMG